MEWRRKEEEDKCILKKGGARCDERRGTFNFLVPGIEHVIRHISVDGSCNTFSVASPAFIVQLLSSVGICIICNDRMLPLYTAYSPPPAALLLVPLLMLTAGADTGFSFRADAVGGLVGGGGCSFSNVKERDEEENIRQDVFRLDRWLT